MRNIKMVELNTVDYGDGYTRTYYTDEACKIDAVHVRAHRGGCLWSGYVKITNLTTRKTIDVDSTMPEMSAQLVSDYARRTL